MDGKNQRDTACVANAVADPGCNLGMNIVARRQFTACLGDSDNGSARTQFLAGDAEVLITLHIHGGHADVVRVVEPPLASQFLFVVGHRSGPPGLASYCLYLIF